VVWAFTPVRRIPKIPHLVMEPVAISDIMKLEGETRNALVAGERSASEEVDDARTVARR
jgi:hypothetical protein